ncbi:hypothetical protein DYB28_006037 [Aphanomyces astaci]|uniref:SCP domain-containing protein n=1 Tax=Aphanomyces astaci TaxID=112090 RepID=A0A9X8E5V0_APHAT|nr:hypothetical protein DYB28_006037 [Aphanomyces astaci]
MTTTTFLSAYTLGLAAIANYAQAHGRLIAPPHRGYIGQLDQFAGIIPFDYDDHNLNGGGIAATSGGKFGVCGDSYSGNRLHETGGTYGTFPTNGAKAIGACYAPGSTVDLQVQLMANHKGYFEFGLCKLDTIDDKETNECFQTLAQPSGETQWQLPPGNEVFTIPSVLPAGVTCEGDAHCVVGASWLWYDEEETFWNYDSNTCNGDWAKCGHFTNLISPEVNSIGCGWKECANGNYVWCNYNTPVKNPKVSRIRGITKAQLLASLTV